MAMTPEDEIFYSVALSVLPANTLKGIWERIRDHDPFTFHKIIHAEKDMKTQDYLAQAYGNDSLRAAEKIIMKCRSKSVNIIHFWHPDYPPLLREISRPPLVLYWKGPVFNTRSMAVVGTRNSDGLSERIAARISGELANRGYAVVSGMAIGIDRAAHCGALAAGGQTVGILANGIDIVYPSSNRDIYKQIESSDTSALISEYPPEILAGKWTFVRRNRIISGISLGTVVVKAGLKSGALITARYAAEQNREVFACPGNSYDQGYAGCNGLIKNGAVLVGTTEDIFNEIPCHAVNGRYAHEGKKPGEVNHKSNPVMEPPGDDSLKLRIFSLLNDDEMDIDAVIHRVNEKINDVQEAIMLLELTGMIRRKGNYISKV